MRLKSPGSDFRSSWMQEPDAGSSELPELVRLDRLNGGRPDGRFATEKQKRREGRRVARPRCRRSSVRIARIGPQRVIRAVSGCLVALGRSRRAAFWPMFMDGPD